MSKYTYMVPDKTITPNKIIQDFFITKKGANGKLRTMNKTELWEVVDEITKKFTPTKDRILNNAKKK